MRAPVLEEFNKPLIFKELDLEDPGWGEVTLEVKACGLCLTDVHICEGHIPTVTLPHVLGHEFSGVILKKGPGVVDFEIGDRVVPSIDVVCGRCEFCLKGETNRCANLTRIGFERKGGMGALVNAPATNLEKMAGTLSFEKAAVIPDAVASMYRAIKTVGQVSVGSRIAILGIGGLGMQGIKIAKLLGANVTCTSRNQEKLEKAKHLGADQVINTKKENYLEVSRREVGDFDVVFDNIGIRESVLDGIASCKNGGRVVVVGYVVPTMEFPAYDVVINEKQILGSRAYTRNEFREIVQLVNSGQIDPDIGEILPIDKVNEALADLKGGKYQTRTVLTFPS